MAVGKSGRVVVELDPVFKRELYATLDRDGLSLKEWFTRSARRYVDNSRQPELTFSVPRDSGPAQGEEN